MRVSFETYVDAAVTDLGADFAAEADSEEEYQEGLEYAIEILQESLAISRGFAGDE